MTRAVMRLRGVVVSSLHDGNLTPPEIIGEWAPLFKLKDTLGTLQRS